MAEEEQEVWKPKTELGRLVKQGKLTDIHEALNYEKELKEPEIIDHLVPNLDEEVILIGGSPGKGGGKRRTASKRTVRMHKSGRRFKSKAMVVIGNKNGLLGVGEGYADDTREAIDNARENAKLDLIEIRRGNGSWEDRGTQPNTIPFREEGKSGSVEVGIKPAPKGTGLAASEGIKKMLELSGVEDIWVQSRGNTRTRENLVKATFNAFKNMNKIKMPENAKESTGLIRGKV
ncbi:MAG: 30S ribosomal protein S5 [Candidatus Nanohaloarchaeota archaeon QJJ-9]|nr:30S ribosomal protein S5 [Candidatus Nanohaloarchaeota archaeon QJJ-9]